MASLSVTSTDVTYARLQPVVLIDCTKRYLVQRARPLNIVDYSGEGSSFFCFLCFGNAQLLRYGPENVGLGGDFPLVFFFFIGLLLEDWCLRQDCFVDCFVDSFSDCFVDCFGDGRCCRSSRSLDFRRWIRLIFPPLFGNPMEVFSLVGRLN